MTKSPKDIGASVRARLLRLAHERGEDFQLVLTRYANERLLYGIVCNGGGEQNAQGAVTIPFPGHPGSSEVVSSP